jgi:hypothetical protein
MKHLILITILGLASTGAFAEQRIKTDLQAVQQVGQLPSHAEPLIESDQQGMGRVGTFPPARLNFELEPGHYIIGEEGNFTESQSLFVQKSINNADSFLGLLVSHDTLKKGHGNAKILFGYPVKSGNTIKFSPMRIGKMGNLVSVSETERNAKVYYVSVKRGTDKVRYPYRFSGINGSTDGIQLGMRGGSMSTSLAPIPAGGTFHWSSGENGIDGSLTVEQNGQDYTVQSFRRGQDERTFKMIQLNGEGSGMSGLLNNTTNTMSDVDSVNPKIVRIAFFMNLPRQSKDVMIIGSPIGGGDDFALSIYTPAKFNFFDWLFNGSLTPTKKSWLD